MLHLALKLQNKDFLKELKHIKKLSIMSKGKILDFQEEKLRKLLYHSWKNVPYYTRVLEQSRVVVDGEVFLENFEEIPILTKDIIKNEWNDLVSSDYKKRRTYINYSGGSTGVPMKLMQDQRTWIHSTATKWFFFSLIHKFPCKNIKLWGSERDIINKTRGLKNAIISWLYKQKILNCFYMPVEKMHEFVNEINRYKPKIIEAYVQPLFELAKFIEEHNLKIHSPTGIISSAGTLYPHIKEKVESVFRCKVLNRYGTREVGDIACSTFSHDYLHLASWDHYLEIINNNLIKTQSGDTGKIIITLLNNYSMPLIRYDIGDIGTRMDSYEHENCEINSPTIKSVTGREMNVLKNKNGAIIPAEFFIHFIGVVFNKESIQKFQIIQEKLDCIKILYVESKKKLIQKDKEDIEGVIKKVMGNECLIEWKKVSEISALHNGKYMYVISKLED